MRRVVVVVDGVCGMVECALYGDGGWRSGYAGVRSGVFSESR